MVRWRGECGCVVDGNGMAGMEVIELRYFLHIGTLLGSFEENDGMVCVLWGSLGCRQW